jgi:phage shock protein A
MGLFDRMSRAASANFNALVSKLEDPKKEIEQTLREMEEQLRLARREVVNAVAAEKQARKKVEEVGVEIERWEKRAELAVQHGDDDLAREALRQKRRLSGERERAEQLRATQLAAARDQKTELERMETTLEDARARKGILAARLGQSRAGGSAEGLGAPPGGGAFAEFRRMEDQIEGVEAALAAEREVNAALAPPRGPTGLGADELEAKFRALEARSGGTGATAGEDVDDELTALKTRIRVETR